jgi:hypothetical protein
MEVLQNDELQAILGRNDVLGENPCNTITPGKSRCAVRGERSDRVEISLLSVSTDDRFDLLHLEQDPSR